MEEKNNSLLRRNLLGVLSIILISFFLVTIAKAETLPSLPGNSIVNLQFANNEFIFSPRTLKWKAINDNGKVVRTGRGSGGRSYCPDIRRSCHTPTGTYTIISKGDASCRSSRYPVGHGGAPMPYCMFFSKYYAIHGSPDVPNRNASHGCIRVLPSEARWLNKNFVHVGTKVVVQPY